MAPVSETMLAEAAVVCDEIERAHERCGQAHARVMELEDLRQAIKPEAIQRIVQAGKAGSPSAAEKLVEKEDPEYIAHRRAQFDAEIEKWRALGGVEVARLKRRLTSALVDNGETS
jgi:F0F1-type ATP synthase membrane subunit b/b'